MKKDAGIGRQKETTGGNPAGRDCFQIVDMIDAVQIIGNEKE